MNQASDRHQAPNAVFPTCRPNLHFRAALYLALVVIGLASTLGFCPSLFAADAQPIQIVVRVNNYAKVSSASLATAEREVARIFAAAGLQILWTNCPPTGSTSAEQDPCSLPLVANEVVVRLIPEAINHQYQDSIFGFAVVPLFATINMNYVVRSAQRDNAEAEMPIVLGTAIAHEIGHLLLGLKSHSPAGIMQPNWGRSQLHQALMGGLLFSPGQAERIRSEVKSRIEKPAVAAAN